MNRSCLLCFSLGLLLGVAGMLAFGIGFWNTVT